MRVSLARRQPVVNANINVGVAMKVYFVDVTKAHSQLTFSKGDDFR